MTIRTPVNSYSLSAGNGSQTTFAFPFSQFETDDLFVYVWNSTTEQWDKKTSGTHYNINASTVVFTAGNVPSAPPTGVTGNVLVLRKTDVDEDYPQALFSAGSAIKSGDLNNNQKQALRAIKELRDTYLSAYAQVDETTGTPANPKMYANLNMTGRRIYNLADANSDDDAVTRKQLGDVLAVDVSANTSQGIDIVKTQGGSNSGDQLTITARDSSPNQKGTVIITPAATEAINVSYNSGIATIGVDKSTALQQGVVRVSQAVGEAANVTYTADGEVTVGVDKSTASQQGVVRVQQAAGEAVNVAYTADGEVTVGVDKSTTAQQGVVRITQAAGEAANVTYTADGEVTVGVDKSTAAQQGVVRITAASPVTIARSADGEVELGIANNSVDLDKLKQSDLIDYLEQASGYSVWDDHQLPTAAAAALRFDTIVQTATPTGTAWPIGKTWLQNDTNKTVSIWNGSAWLGVASGGTFTTQPTVIYVDAVNGNDTNDGHRIINPKRTIKNAVQSASAGDLIIVNPGIYQEILPIDITVANLSIVGTALRSVFVHPTPATETNTMFRCNSGTYIANMTLTGLKASGARGSSTLDPGSPYGLPSSQGWIAAFYPGALIKKSPYIHNCTNFSDSGINNASFDPNDLSSGGGGDLTSGVTGGGILVDGSVPSTSSPLRSFVTDSFTHVGLDGPGILVTNNGYVQATSSYAFFCHYHIKALNGGQANLSASTSDFGRYGLIADGRSPSAIFTSTVNGNAAAGATSFTINAPTAAGTWFGSATRPANNMLLDVVDSAGTTTYEITGSTASGSGWVVNISRPDPSDRSVNLGLANAITSGAAVSFFLRSMIASSGHTMEYVGSGTDYRALPENGGVPDDTKQVVELNSGRVWAVSVDHKGTLKAGNTFTVNQQTGFVTIPSGAIKFTNYVAQTGATGAAAVPTGTTAQRPSPATAGQLRFNDETSSFEGYNGSSWANIASGGGGGATGGEFLETPQTITLNKVIAANTNAAVMGPSVGIASGVTITVGTNSLLTVIK